MKLKNFKKKFDLDGFVFPHPIDPSRSTRPDPTGPDPSRSVPIGTRVPFVFFINDVYVDRDTDRDVFVYIYDESRVELNTTCPIISF